MIALRPSHITLPPTFSLHTSFSPLHASFSYSSLQSQYAPKFDAQESYRITIFADPEKTMPVYEVILDDEIAAHAALIRMRREVLFEVWVRVERWSGDWESLN